MRLSRRAALLLRLAVGVGLAFIYIPLIVIAIYAFNSSNILEWPPPGLTLDWFPKAIENEFAREAFFTSLKAGLAATALALVLGTLASLAVARHRFFGRETISFLVILPIALPGIVTGVALSNTFTQVLGVQLTLMTVIIGHATFCIVVVYNNVVARLRRTGGSFEEASSDLGGDTWQTFRLVTLPALRTAMLAGADREVGDDDLVEGEGEGEQATCDQGAAHRGKGDEAEGLPGVGAEVGRGLLE